MIQAFRKIDRAEFTLSSYQDQAYIDKAPHDQTISQPSVATFMLELLNPQGGDKIINIGCKSD